MNITPPATQRPLWRTWIETRLDCWFQCQKIRHNVLFGGRGLKLDHPNVCCKNHADTTSSLEDVDWNCFDKSNFVISTKRHNVLFGGRGLKRKVMSTEITTLDDTTSSLEDVDWNIAPISLLDFLPSDTTSSLEDVDWNIHPATKKPVLRLTQRPLWRTWIETVTVGTNGPTLPRHNVLFGGRGLKPG